MAVVALLLRPIFGALHDLLVHQTISPGDDQQPRSAGRTMATCSSRA